MSFSNYLNEIAMVPRLTHQEEIELGTIIQQNKGTHENPGTPEQQAIRQEAIAKLASGNLRLVVKYACYHRGGHHDIEELTAEGNQGLMIAAARYDPTKGARFSTYATLWIQQSIRLAVHGSRTIRTPLRHASKLDKLISSNAYDPSKDEQDIAKLSQQTCLDPEHVEKLLKKRIQLVPLDTLIHDSDEEDTAQPELQDLHTPDSQLEETELREMLRKVLLELSVTKRAVLTSRYGLDNQPVQTLEEIARVMSLSRDRVRKIHMEGVRMLQEEIQKLGYNISPGAIIKKPAKAAAKEKPAKAAAVPVRRVPSAETRAKLSLARRLYWAKKGRKPSIEFSVPSLPEPSPASQSSGLTSIAFLKPDGKPDRIDPATPTYRSLIFQVLNEAQRPISLQEACEAAKPLIERMNIKGRTPMLSFKAKFYVAAKKGEISRIGDRFALPTQDLKIELSAVPSATKAEIPITKAPTVQVPITETPITNTAIAEASIAEAPAARAKAEKRTWLGGWRRRISTAIKVLCGKQTVPAREEDYQI